MNTLRVIVIVAALWLMQLRVDGSAFDSNTDPFRIKKVLVFNQISCGGYYNTTFTCEHYLAGGESFLLADGPEGSGCWHVYSPQSNTWLPGTSVSASYRVDVKTSAGTVLGQIPVGSGVSLPSISVPLPAGASITLEVPNVAQGIPVKWQINGGSWSVGGSIDLTALGEFTIALQLGDAAIFTFKVYVRSIVFTADPGQIHRGFDPPNPAEGDTANEPYWASVIQGQSNTFVNLKCGSNAAAQDLELKFRNEADTGYAASSSYATVSPMTFTTANTDLTITGTTAGGSTIKDVKLHLVDKNNGSIKERFTIKVLPLRTLTVGIYSLEDPNSPATQFATAPAVAGPSVSATLGVLNDAFWQAGVQFVAHSSSGPVSYPYDTRGIGSNGLYNSSLPTRPADGKMDMYERLAGYSFTGYTGVWDTIFPAPPNRRIFYVRKSAIPYDGYPSIMIRGSEIGVVFAEDARGLAALAGTHEIGHKLELSTVNEGPPPGGHDVPPYPPGVDADNPGGVAPIFPGAPHHLKPLGCLMGSGSPSEMQPGSTLLPWLHGRWFRHEDWDKANEKAVP